MSIPTPISIQIRHGRPRRIRTALLVCLLALPPTVLAAGAGASTITAITLYPGSATIERTLQVEPGARDATFFCLSPKLDPASLQVQGDAAIQVGEITLEQQPARLLGDTCASPLAERIATLEEQIAAAQVERDSLDFTVSYLKGFAQAEKGETQPSTQIRSTAATLHELALDALTRQQRLQKRKESLQRELEPLLAERDRKGGEEAEVSTVRVRLVTLDGGALRLRYQVAGPSWQPGYRASLDTEAQSVHLERLALVRQDSGEDWEGVRLTLSTGQPAAATAGPLPRPWRVSIRSGQEVAARLRESEAFAKIAPALAPASSAAPAPALFQVSVTDSAFATEFSIPQRVTILSDAEQSALALGEEALAAVLRVRSAPALDRNAYLLAEIKPPEGVWPVGRVMLYRDGAFVGTGTFDPRRVAREGLAFGPDERTVVQVERPEEKSGTRGFITTQNRRVDDRRYKVTNRHDTPVLVQILDAAPVSESNKIQIESAFRPEPQTTSWLDQPGNVAWEQELAAGATQEFSATHTITWPKDETLREQR